MLGLFHNCDLSDGLAYSISMPRGRVTYPAAAISTLDFPDDTPLTNVASHFP
jgi:hypothetical protein